MMCYSSLTSCLFICNCPHKLTPWCQRGGTPQLTGRPCSCTRRRKAARWHACGTWSVKWRRPRYHRWLPPQHHPTQPPGRRWVRGNHPSLSLCPLLQTPQKGGTAPRRGERERERGWAEFRRRHKHFIPPKDAKTLFFISYCWVLLFLKIRICTKKLNNGLVVFKIDLASNSCLCQMGNNILESSSPSILKHHTMGNTDSCSARQPNREDQPKRCQMLLSWWALALSRAFTQNSRCQW